MGNLVTLVKKEIIEIKQVKYIGLLALLVLFGIGTPILLNMLPIMLESSGKGYLKDMMPNLMNFPSIMESYLSGVSQLGLLAVIFTYSGLISEERSKGITSLILVKSVSRSTYLVSKIISAFISAFLLTLISIICLLYSTWVFVPDFSAKNFMISASVILLYIIMVAIISVEFSALFKKSWVGGLAVLSITFVIGLLPTVLPKKIAVYSPSNLFPLALNISKGNIIWNDIWPSILGAVICMVAFYILSIRIFSKTEL